MIQKTIVAVILIVTGLLTVRWLVRTLRNQGGCGCQGCSRCPKGGQHCHCYKERH